jgi:DNA-binding protein HU-beta
MNKAELQAAIAKDSGVTQADAGRVIDAFVTTIQKALKKGDDVTLVGFGTFKVVKRKDRKGVNPQTGKTITLPARKVVKFVSGKALREAVAK